MRLLFVADGRSPIALNWIQHFVSTGHEIHLVSTFPCEPDLPLASLNNLPLAFSKIKSQGKNRNNGVKGILRGAITVGLRTAVRQWFGPFTLDNASEHLCRIITHLQPDLVHAMRIPFEGMLASKALDKCALSQKLRGFPPLLISVWGNDFTLHATSTPVMARWTTFALNRADALHTDCHRDLRLAHNWGFLLERPAVVLPGGGGVRFDIFFPPNQEKKKTKGQSPVVINPRGIRAYIRNDIFFRAVKLVREKRPGVRFLCPAMKGDPQIERWLDELGISPCVDLLPKVHHHQMADLFRQSQIAVSPSTHDGTPNTLLEAMACGCFPVAGDIESLREWIIPGVNGLLVDPSDPQDLAQSIIQALSDGKLRERAARYNARLVAKRASHVRVMVEAEKFYQELVKEVS